MSQRTKIAKEINTLEKEILSLEAKRSRSMAVLLEALISKTTPNDEDVQFFRTFSATIEIKREQLQMLTRQLEGML